MVVLRPSFSGEQRFRARSLRLAAQSLLFTARAETLQRTNDGALASASCHPNGHHHAFTRM
jgi:hypothetical protein